jgi:hypothetical protein
MENRPFRVFAALSLLVGILAVIALPTLRDSIQSIRAVFAPSSRVETQHTDNKPTPKPPVYFFSHGGVSNCLVAAQMDIFVLIVV